MFESKHYDWSLFIGHLVIEKLLKALFIKTNDDIDVSKIHNLVLLADRAKLILTDFCLKNLT